MLLKCIVNNYGFLNIANDSKKEFNQFCDIVGFTPVYHTHAFRYSDMITLSIYLSRTGPVGIQPKSMAM